MPATANGAEYDNSWVCTPYNSAVTYPLEKLRLIKNADECFPRHTILLRSLNEVANARLVERLRQEFSVLVPIRQVCLFDGANADYLRHQNTNRGLRLFESTEPNQAVIHERLGSRMPRIFAR